MNNLDYSPTDHSPANETQLIDGQIDDNITWSTPPTSVKSRSSTRDFNTISPSADLTNNNTFDNTVVENGNENYLNDEYDVDGDNLITERSPDIENETIQLSPNNKSTSSSENQFIGTTEAAEFKKPMTTLREKTFIMQNVSINNDIVDNIIVYDDDELKYNHNDLAEKIISNECDNNDELINVLYSNGHNFLPRPSICDQFDPLYQNGDHSISNNNVSMSNSNNNSYVQNSSINESISSNKRSPISQQYSTHQMDTESTMLIKFTPARPLNTNTIETKLKSPIRQLLSPSSSSPPMKSFTKSENNNTNINNKSPKPDVLCMDNSYINNSINSNCNGENNSKLNSFVEEQKEFNENLDKLRNKCVEYEQIISFLNTTIIELRQDFGDQLMRMEADRNNLIEKCNQISQEKDHVTEDLHGVENSFSELHRRFEKMKASLEASKKIKETLLNERSDLETELNNYKAMYEKKKKEAESNIDSGNAMIEEIRKTKDREITVLRTQLKQTEMKIIGLQGQVEQKNQENAQLNEMVNELTKLEC